MKNGTAVQKESNVDLIIHDGMKHQRVKLLTSTANICIFLLISLLFSLSWADEDTLTKGELLRDQNSDTSALNQKNDQSDWLLGKIEPVLAQEYEGEAELKVIVYVESPDLTAISRAIEARFSPELDSYSEQIRVIQRKYRPKRSLRPDEERASIIEQGLAMTAEDRTELEALQRKHDGKLDEMRREVGLVLKRAVQPNQEKVANFIASQGGMVTSRIAVISAIGATIPSNFLMALANHPLVLCIMKDRPTQFELDVSIPTCDYDTWWNDGIDGGAYDFGIVDTGVQEDHPAFSGVSFYTNSGSSSDSDGHGTHVTGIASSADVTYRGGAYGLDAIIWSSASGGQASVFNQMEWQASSAGQNPEVINHSLGYGTANGTDYSNNDAFYDAFVNHYNIMVSKSAGNGSWSNTAPTITHPATAYNLLAVADIDDQNTTSRSDDVRSSTSSVGPTLNNRKKPDITAPGTNIMSCNNDWNDWLTNDFVSMSGTSMAAPHVAGAIVLMEEGGNHNPLAQKAVLINTADAWDSNNTSNTSDDGAVSGSHWDKSYGWGYLDMWEAHYNRSDYFENSVVPNNSNATPDDYRLYKGVMYANEKATLVWTKRAGYAAGATPTNQYALSDLDLRLYNEADGSVVDSDTDSNDNVHQVSASSDIDAVIKVYSWSTSFDGASTEPFVLATEENFAEANPPNFVVSLTMPPSVNTDTQFTVTVYVTNSGDVDAHNNDVTLTVPFGFSIVSGSNPQNIGTIEDGSSGQASWTVHSSSTPGNYNLSASNTSSSYYETYTGSSSPTPITVTGSYALVNDTPVTFSEIPKDFSFEVKSYDWCGVAINPSEDHDIRVDDDSDFGSTYESSTYTGTRRDFIVTNGHSWGNATHYAEVYFGYSSNYTIEAEWEAFDLSVGTGYSDTINSDEVIQMYEVSLTNGVTYDLNVNISSGGADLSVYVFKPSRSSGSRADRDWIANNSGSGGDESVSFTSDSSGYYGIAVLNENARSANYNIRVNSCTAPVAAFSGSPRSGCAPLTVNFTDQSTGSPTSWSWSFGDGGTSTVKNPSHIYAGAGTWAVTLTVSNSCGSDSETKTGYITVNPVPVADFTASPSSGCAPLTVNFTDQSTGTPTSWSWSFGDGGTSTQRNPSHTYNSSGTYTVILTASNACGSDTETKTGYITVNPALSYITISGSTQVNENSGAQYTCTAYYSDGSNSNVTSSASWSENSSYASISSSGYLTTSSVSSDQSCTITATYGGKSDTHSVTIKEGGGKAMPWLDLLLLDD